jgi:HJR/Mrr/RecB family endonuclease
VLLFYPDKKSTDQGADIMANFGVSLFAVPPKRSFARIAMSSLQ